MYDVVVFTDRHHFKGDHVMSQNTIPVTYALTKEQTERLNRMWNRSTHPDPNDFIAQVLDTGLYQLNYRREYTKKVNEERKQAVAIVRAAQRDPDKAKALGIAHEGDVTGVTIRS